ncbi:kelch repeat-containing protein [Wenyingzhuangia sp. 2_MG-2023]|uniref:Kelch repeat-containing protein n=1 Tax=Wenyingzhuangia sp. 2_MG-2023 TaxID=3062639 RepID=UPI0026E28CE5|nr:kelch repeat-containing protein [Wenyingzhuangia sp. 2_MG-2023]MDO6738148.1 kelch repeat-containing protein [Wenyingzhuangia sp. 2_MG-2023]MDO6801528.1 kelch repeat-containing protein [Wenyingzhuangia sp. 1_MG-2023]
MNLIQKGNILFLTILALIFTGCSSDDDDDEYGNWVESSTFDGNSRSNSVSFTIGDKGYLVAGFDGDDYLNDTWEYNSNDDYWVNRADFPGEARTGAVAFAIDGKGYVGTGYNGDSGTRLKDFWEYDPATDTWTQKADFGGDARYGAIGFSINSNGYVGTGYTGSEQKDFWKYDPTTDTWEEVYGYGGSKRREGTVFVIDNVAYIGFGLYNGAYENDFYSFDGTTWTKLTDLDDDDNDDEILLSNAVGFVLDGKGYISTGIAGTLTTETWVYDPTLDVWEDVPNFEGSARQDACAFTFDTKAFVMMGRNGSYYFDDIWEFRPDELEDDED